MFPTTAVRTPQRECIRQERPWYAVPGRCGGETRDTCEDSVGNMIDAFLPLDVCFVNTLPVAWPGSGLTS